MKVGSKAPNFNLPDKSGKLISLKDLSGEYNVVYFYPKDNTPGCTIEAQEFTGALEKFKKLKTSVVGISGGDNRSKAKFCRDKKLKVTLLSDSDLSVSKKFGVFGTKKFMGRSFKGIKRITFLLDRSGKVLKVFDKVKPETHAAELLKAISALTKTTGKKPTTKLVSAKITTAKKTAKKKKTAKRLVSAKRKTTVVSKRAVSKRAKTSRSK